MGKLGQLLFGAGNFEDREEYLEFQFKFLCIVILAGAFLTGLLVLGAHSAVNRINPAHVRSMTVFTGLSILAWLLLRGRKERFLPVAWAYEALCLLEYISALYYVSEDEFRVVWFLTNIPGVFLLLGQRLGVVITAGTAAGLIVGNPYLPSPYSPNAMATLLASIMFLGVFFYAYADRSLSYYLRLRSLNEKLFHMAMHDQLTGVLNAQAYYQICDQLIQGAQRKGAPYSVLFIDLDHFKSVNDNHGHAAGDLVLKTASACVGKTVRASDLVGRVGGEEFSVYLPDTSLPDAVTVAEKIRAAIAALDIELAPGKRLRISASIGVARNKGRSETLAEIQQQADMAMYEAKKSGRNKVSCFDEAIAA